MQLRPAGKFFVVEGVGADQWLSWKGGIGAGVSTAQLGRGCGTKVRLVWGAWGWWLPSLCAAGPGGQVEGVCPQICVGCAGPWLHCTALWVGTAVLAARIMSYRLSPRQDRVGAGWRHSTASRRAECSGGATSHIPAPPG